MKVSKRLHYIDVLNCLAILFVLLLHSSQLAHFGTHANSNYVLTEVMQCLFIPAVYIFFMNSGATLLDYRNKYSTNEFFKKRVKRVLIPFLVWSIIYYFFDSRFHAFPGPIFQTHVGLNNFISQFINNNINNLFWFFYTIISLYLITPIFSILSKNHKKLLLYVVIAYFCFTDLISYIGSLAGIDLQTKFISQPLISSSYLGFFVVGYLIKENYFTTTQTNIFIIVGMVCLFLNILNVLTNLKIRALNNIGPFLYSVGLYLLIKKIVDNYHIRYKTAEWLSGSSLGIYILHPLFYALFDKVVFHTSSGDWSGYMHTLSNPIHILIMPFVVYIIIAVPLHYLKKLKLIKMIIP